MTEGGGHMTQYRVGYFVGSLSSTSINRLLAKALARLARRDRHGGGAAMPPGRAVLLQFAPEEHRRGLCPVHARAHEVGAARQVDAFRIRTWGG